MIYYSMFLIINYSRPLCPFLLPSIAHIIFFLYIFLEGWSVSATPLLMSPIYDF
jgi:hypothetical protein